MGLPGPVPPAEQSGPLARSASSRGVDAADLFLIDLAQGVTAGGVGYLLVLGILHATAPPPMMALMVAGALWAAWSAWHLAWRDAMLAFGLVLGVASNLLTPVLLFLLYLAGWSRPQRALTLPWVALGLACFALGAAFVRPEMLVELQKPHIESLYYYYLVPVSFGALSCATVSHFTVSLARDGELATSRRLLGLQWVSLLAVVCAFCGVGGAVLRYSGW